MKTSLIAAALLLAALLPLAAQAQPSASAASTVPAWQRNAVPFYDTVHALQGIYGHWALPRAQDFDRNARALVPAVAALCQAPAADGKAALESARTAWQATARAWEQLAAVSVGPVIARRSQRAIDFTPTRPALIEKAIAAQPQGAKAFERIGTPAKGLPALEWLLWTRPAQPGSPACSYAHEVAQDVARESAALTKAFTDAAATDWGAEDEQEGSTQAISEFVNQWVGGIERLRWAQMDKPLRAAQGTRTPDYPRTASGNTLAAWAATWGGLRSVTTLAASADIPAAGEALVPLEMYLRGKGLNPLADKLREATDKVDTSMAQVQKSGLQNKAAVQQTARDLAALKFLAESEVAPALQVSIGFSDADGD
ncbi:imelysin family protein [Acidovorax sp. sic0104]|uniref:imelysin family protein n=1 Tax=Acidovorax sp. sic0104 TaxID=2854784 RepID=UPI001C44CDAF|nr:imelysin family protein [Acidovorax sp. sic0104]MBV7543709.1 imelysin family protein [Acidovorax sp. sic0104]